MSDLKHDTLIFTKDIACPPERLFTLLTEPAYRAAWAAPNEGVTLDIVSANIRPGGRELSRCGPADNPEFEVTTDFHVIDAPHIILCTETIVIGGAPLSSGLVTFHVTPHTMGAQLTVTTQLASLIGDEMAGGYSEGWTAALTNLARLAQKETA